MRDEKTMFNLILSIAEEDPSIRAVVLNGSRANPNAKKDIFQDYDVVYFVEDFTHWDKGLDWLNQFGDILIMQSKEDQIFDPPEPFDHDIYLMQFKDGTRIDLSVQAISTLEQHIEDDSLSKCLLDKDNRLKNPPVPSDVDYYVKPPKEPIFNSCVNEFQWVSLYVSKGLWRQEYIYAIDHLDIMRRCLKANINWWIGMHHYFKVSVGKSCKHYKNYIDEDWLKQLMATYPQANKSAIYQSLKIMMGLFKTVSVEVSEGMGFEFNTRLHQSLEDTIDALYALPEDAKSWNE